MCSNFFKGLFGGGQDDALKAMLFGQQQQAEKASADAEDAMQAAIKQAQQAATPPMDSEAGRQAAEDRWRKLLSATGAGTSFGGGPMGAPNVATKMLFGA